MQKIIFAFILASLLVLPSVTNFIMIPADAAAADYYLKLEGVDGETTRTTPGWIAMDSYSFDVKSSTDSASGMSTGKSKIDFSFVKKIDKASPKLFMSSVVGDHYATAIIEIQKPGKSEVFLKYELKDVVISSYQVNGGTDLTEQISLNFGKIVIEYKPQNPDGTLGTSVKVGWDVKSNKKIDTGSSTSTTTSTPKDSDGDGITDDKDKCPTTVETKNKYQDDDGCPDAAPAATTVKPKLVVP